MKPDDVNRLVKYREWLDQLTRSSDVGFTVSPEGWVEAMSWALDTIEGLEQDLEEMRYQYNKTYIDLQILKGD